MRDLIQWIVLLGMVGVGLLFLVEVRKWRLLGPIMTRGQRILRVMLIVFIESLFVMMLIGPSVTGRHDPITSLFYWTVCLVLGLVVIVLALLDLRTVVNQYARLNRQMFRDLSARPQQDGGMPPEHPELVEGRRAHPEHGRTTEDDGPKK